MTELPDPLRRVLDARSTESEILGVWRGVQRKRRARSRPGVPIAAGALVLAGTLLAAVLLLRAPEPAPSPPVAPGALAFRTPAAGPPILPGVELEALADLSDGSRVRVARGARLAVLENSAHTFRTFLTRGRAEFSVKPGGARRWVVDCGAAAIEVVGTEFAVERAEHVLRVSVQHGTVLVRGESVPDRLQRLNAGQSLELALAAPATSAAATAAPAVTPSATPLASAPAPSSSAAPTAETLLDEADRARRERRPVEAVGLLEQSLALKPRGHRASLAAFTLGRLYLDQLGSPASAARAFRRALAAGAPADLEEDVRARLVEAHARMGDAAGTRQAAGEYRARFPNGRRGADVDRHSPPE